MKHLKYLVVVFALLLSLVLVGCGTGEGGGEKKPSKTVDELKTEVAALKEKGIVPCLAVIQVGNDPASSVYVSNKKKACAYIGIESLSYELDEQISQEELLTIIDELNHNEMVNGILVQLPLPKHIDEKAVIKFFL